MLGQLRNVLVCSDVPTGTVAPCPAGQAPALIQAYVLDPVAASYLDAVAAPFDYATASAFWTSAFVFTLTLYLGSRIYGTIINLVR